MIVPSYLGYDEIGEKAYEFLEMYHPSFELPIPIEEIADLKLGLDIVEKANLEDNYRIDGFLTSDCTAIYVDETCYESNYERCRFTLAHEVGHLILHRQFYEEHRFNSAAEYIEFVMTVDRAVIDRFEVQGILFAEQVLVPEPKLEPVLREVVARNLEVLGMVSTPTLAIPYIAKQISRPFQVSSRVIECRINHLGQRMDIAGMIREELDKKKRK
jgi:Zn-dependent peptidase ImmA (M78 family)